MNQCNVYREYRCGNPYEHGRCNFFIESEYSYPEGLCKYAEETEIICLYSCNNPKAIDEASEDK